MVPIIKINDATKRVEKNNIFKNIRRKSLRFSQTPQGFTFKKIYEKHMKNRRKNQKRKASKRQAMNQMKQVRPPRSNYNKKQ